MATQKTRWVCETCGSGKLGPQRPRKDNVVRYCLPCSEKTGRLVQRAAPAVQKRREAQAEKAKAKRERKAQRERERERKRSTLTLTDATGRKVEVHVQKEVMRLARKAGVSEPDLSWNRRTDGCNSGRAWWHEERIHLSIGSSSLEAFCRLVAHELAHIGVPKPAKHSDVWRDEYERICAALWDTKPVFRGAVTDHRYAIDPEIQDQLVATSKGEYKRSKAKLPLAGTYI